MREANVWKWLNEGRPHWLEMERFEVLTPPGTSDILFTDRRSRISGWLEIKFCKEDDREFRAGRIPKIRPEQPMFLTRQRLKGLPCGLLLEVENHGVYLWVPPGNRHWNNIVRSNEALSEHVMYWPSRPKTADIITTILSHCEL